MGQIDIHKIEKVNFNLQQNPLPLHHHHCLREILPRPPPLSPVAGHTSSKAQEYGWELYKASRTGKIPKPCQKMVNTLEGWFHASEKGPRRRMSRYLP